MDSKDMSKLPVIHLTGETLNPGTSLWNEACKDVRKALEEYGCFMAIHDQFSSDQSSEFTKSLQDLFDLPLETKMHNTSFNPSFGYLGPTPTLPLQESMGFIGSPNLTDIESFANKLWPSGNEKFSEIWHFFGKKLSKLDKMVGRMTFESYGVEHHLDSYLESYTYLMRFIKYSIPQENQINIGADTHTDKALFTILYQNQVPGLQVLTKQENWINVHFSPSSLFFFAGDSLKAWSNGKIHAPKHRVIIRGKEERYTVAQFSYPLADKLVNAPEEFIDDDHPSLYKPLDIDGYIKFFFTQKGRQADDSLEAYCGRRYTNISF